MTVFIELQCDQFEVPVGGEAIVRLADGHPHSIDVDRDWVTIWDEGGDASVEVISSGDKRADDALMLDHTLERLEPAIGYFAARDRVFKAFYAGFAGNDVPRHEDETIVACWRAGGTAARLNEAARTARTFPELTAAPFDTDSARTAFSRALSNGS